MENNGHNSKWLFLFLLLGSRAELFANITATCADNVRLFLKALPRTHSALADVRMAVLSAWHGHGGAMTFSKS